MSLRIRMDINGKVFGEVTVTRPEDTFDIVAAEEVTYRYDYKGALGSIFNGKVVHRPMEGATVLAAKAVNAVVESRVGRVQ